MKFTKLEKILLSLLVIFIIFFSIKSCQNKKEISTYIDKSQLDSLEMKKWIDKYDLEHTESKSLQIGISQFLNSKDSVILKLREQVKKSENLVIKNTVITRTIDNTKPTKIIRDTLYKDLPEGGQEQVLSTSFNYKDEWADISGIIDENDSISMKYNIKNKFDIINSYKSAGFLKPKILTVELINYNPHTTTDKVYSFTIGNKKKKFYETKLFSFILGAGTGYFIKTKNK